MFGGGQPFGIEGPDALAAAAVQEPSFPPPRAALPALIFPTQCRTSGCTLIDPGGWLWDDERGDDSRKLTRRSMSVLVEGQQLGQYRVVCLLGEGGMGAVYEARQEPLDRRVALKTLHPEYAGDKDALARFFNEAKILSQLEHPSIVQVSDFGTAADGTAYLVMEYLRGQSLGRRLSELNKRSERLPVVRALQFGFQIADVLAVAHTKGIVHRDIKPDNLMLISDAIAPGGERVKLLDFGIAKLTHDGDKGGVKTATQTVMGTPSYMSPEQCAGAGGVDAKTDVYALGCVLYEALSGRPPFVAEGAGQLIGMHLFQSPPNLLSVAPKVPSAIAELVHRLLTKDRANRPTMSDAADEIGYLLAKQTGGGPVIRSQATKTTYPAAGQTSVVPSPGTTLGRSTGQQLRSSPRTTALWGLGMVSLLGVGLAVIWRWSAPHPAPTPPAVAQTIIRQPIATPPPTLPVHAPTVQPTVVQARRSIAWRIDSDPPGCAILNDKGRTLGITPFSVSRIAEEGQSFVRVHRDGYTDVKIKLNNEQNESVRVSLIRAASATTQKPTKAPPMNAKQGIPNTQSDGDPYAVPLIR